MDEPSFVALYAICTHKGCEVEYRDGLGGSVLRSPAWEPLARLDAAEVLAPRSKP